MPQPKIDPIQIKLNHQRRNERYRTNPAVQERIKIQRKSYRQKKREQACLKQHADPLAQLADVATQRRYLRDVSGAPADPESVMEEKEEEEREPMVDMGVAMEEDGEILEGFAGSLGGEWDGEDFDDGGGFPDEPESDMDGGGGGFHERFPDEPESDVDVGGGFNEGFPDEPESDTNSDTDDGFPDEPDADDDGS
jgi:hypothetical protein